MASTAAWSAAFSSPRPIRREAASAAASVTRTDLQRQVAIHRSLHRPPSASLSLNVCIAVSPRPPRVAYKSISMRIIRGGSRPASSARDALERAASPASVVSWVVSTTGTVSSGRAAALQQRLRSRPPRRAGGRDIGDHARLVDAPSAERNRRRRGAPSARRAAGSSAAAGTPKAGARDARARCRPGRRPPPRRSAPRRRRGPRRPCEPTKSPSATTALNTPSTCGDRRRRRAPCRDGRAARCRSRSPGDAEQLDAVAELVGERDVERRDVADALDIDARRNRPRQPKASAGQDGELVRGIDAVDVEARVGLGVAQRLRLGQHVGERRGRSRASCVRM